jgi:type II secretory pathway component GspD/PulD (secretin)
VGVLSSEQGQHVAFSDGLLVLGDRVEVLARVDELLTQVEAIDTPAWVLQLHLVALEESALRELGFDARPSLEVAATFAAASAATGTGAGLLSLKGGLDAVLQTAADNGAASLVAEPQFLMADGAAGQFSRSERVPVPRKSVSDQGTVQTVGFDVFEAGLVVNVSLREVRKDAARIKLDLTISDIVGFVEGAPRTRADVYNTEVPIESGGVYLLGSLVRQGDQEQKRGSFRLQASQQRNDSVLQVWARAYRVGAPAQVVLGQGVPEDVHAVE